ncbi:MAG: winged helix-turn-helix domain-containing tetratricopeptide repeat protein [Candidatus Polarisedimenticolia bacterium]
MSDDVTSESIEGRRRLRFGVFVLDLATHGAELRTQAGQLVPMQPQPLRLLILMALRSGEVVSRGDMRHEVWGKETFVDFERGLNFAIKQIRSALGDDARNPRYIETVPRRGYRFIAQVEETSRLPEPAGDQPASAPMPPTQPTQRALAAMGLMDRVRSTGGALLALALLLGVALVASKPRPLQKAAGPIRLVVLPFDNLSGDPAQEYLSDGMSEELIVQLGRLNPTSLAVIARQSAQRYKGGRPDLVRVARDLRVAYVIEGSVRRTQDRLYSTARLVRTTDQSLVWGETYVRPASDVFVVQREIAQRVSRALALKLLPAHGSALARASTLNTAAYEAYLRGRHELRRGTDEGFQTAAAAFKEASQLDPEYAPAHAGLAAAHLSMIEYQFAPVSQACPPALSAAARAHALDPELPEAHVWLAEASATCGGNSMAARASYRRALELNPSDAEAHERYAWHHFREGRRASALAEIAKAGDLDPHSPTVPAAGAYFLLSIGRLDEALKQAHKSLDLEEGFPFALYTIGYAHAGRQEFESALAALQEAVESSGGRPKYLLAYGTVAADAGQSTEAQRMLQRLEQLSRQRYVPASFIPALSASIQSARGRTASPPERE